MGTNVIFGMQVGVICFTDRNQGTISSSKVILGIIADQKWKARQ